MNLKYSLERFRATLATLPKVGHIGTIARMSRVPRDSMRRWMRRDAELRAALEAKLDPNLTAHAKQSAARRQRDAVIAERLRGLEGPLSVPEIEFRLDMPPETLYKIRKRDPAVAAEVARLRAR